MNHSEALVATLRHEDYHTSDDRTTGALGSCCTNSTKGLRTAKSPGADRAVFRPGVETGSIDGAIAFT
jgi:hypothetical protein